VWKNFVVTIECVPNVSEGRRLDVVESIAAAVRRSPGVRLLDYSADAAHHRSVFTFAGDPEAVHGAVLALFERALAAVDLRQHRGEHPRIGAVDVVPLIPLDGARMDDAVRLSRDLGAAIGGRFGVPVFLYEASAAVPGRRPLEAVRRGQFEGLGIKMARPEWLPDFGPSTPHPTAGATAVGARLPLVAFNVNLATDRLDVARAIAAAIRFSSGGLPFVKAMGVRLDDRGIVQVSTNLTDYRQTSMAQVYDAVQGEAARHGTEVLDSEIVGLVPRAALTPAEAAKLRVRDFSDAKYLEDRLARAG
jgi:glutamate formiminotransferase